MLRDYRKEQKKIAMGLLSFHDKLTEYHSLLKEIDMYEKDQQLRLFFWVPEGNQNIQGIVGIEKTAHQLITLHDISVNPSMRGERVGFHVLNELQDRYPESSITGTMATVPYLEKWQKQEKV